MDTTTILPTPPTSGAIVQSSGYDRGYDCIESLILSNNIADNSRAVLAAVTNGTAAIIAADQAGHLVNQKTTGDASVANLKATMDASVAGINSTNMSGTANLKATSDSQIASINATNISSVAGINATNLGAVSTTKAVTDGTVSSLNATNLSGVATQKAVSDAALASALANAEIRELVNTTSAANLMATKDSLVALKDDGCRTREQSAAQYAAIQLEACKNTDAIQREILTTSAAAALQACKDAAALAAQIAECCCEQKLLTLQQGNETRALILAESTKRCEADNAILRQENLLLRINEKGNGK